jgi:hypothetical protein
MAIVDDTLLLSHEDGDLAFLEKRVGETYDDAIERFYARAISDWRQDFRGRDENTGADVLRHSFYRENGDIFQPCDPRDGTHEFWVIDLSVAESVCVDAENRP